MTDTAPRPGTGSSSRLPGPPGGPPSVGTAPDGPEHVRPRRLGRSPCGRRGPAAFRQGEGADRRASAPSGGVVPSTDITPSGEEATQRHGRRGDAIMTARGRRAVRRDGRQGRPRSTGALVGGRSAALLVRVWLEDGAQSFRGRLTTMDTSPGPGGAAELTVALASSSRDVVAAVRAWLDEFLVDASDSVDTGGTGS